MSALTTRASRALSPILRREPFADLQQEMDELLSRFQADWNGGALEMVTAPALDLSETADAYQIKMNLPGVKAEEVNIEVTGNTIAISGEHKEEKEEKGKTFHRIERKCGSFARALTLPASVKEDKVTADCKDGVLTVTLPKTEVAKTQKIKVTPK